MVNFLSKVLLSSFPESGFTADAVVKEKKGNQIFPLNGVFEIFINF